MVGESYPEFRLRRAEVGKVPDGVEYAGILRTPDGEHFGIHARVVELEDGHREFVGGVFRIDEGYDANGSPTTEVA